MSAYALPAPLLPPRTDRRKAVLALLVVLAALLLGSLAAGSPMVALGLALLAPMAAAFAYGRPTGSDVLLVLLFGSVVLNYGWANVGVSAGGFPLPITALLLAIIVPAAIGKMRWILEPGAPALLLLAFVLFATVRVAFDFPVWGVDAVRDYSTPLEMLVFFGGYVAIRDRGLIWSIRAWAVVMAAAVAFGLLFPFRDALAAAGPSVGLQRPVPLISFDGLGASIGAAALFFFFVVRRSWLAVVGGLSALACVLMFQSRGLYVALPIAGLVTLLSHRPGLRPTGRLMNRSVAVAGLGGVALLGMAASGLAFEGRVGALDLGFAQAQIQTLFGDEGPGAGTLEHRRQWASAAIEQLEGDPLYPIVGVGLGPDLAEGFRYTSGVAVRKPHNDFLEIFTRMGLVGFVLWGGFLTTSLAAMWRTARSTADDRVSSFAAWLLGTSVLFLLIALTQPYLAFPYGTIPLSTALGMGVALSQREQGQGEHRRHPQPGIRRRIGTERTGP